jgi:hypothetical protein
MADDSNSLSLSFSCPFALPGHFVTLSPAQEGTESPGLEFSGLLNRFAG